jgi:hypothetical protein
MDKQTNRLGCFTRTISGLLDLWFPYFLDHFLSSTFPKNSFHYSEVFSFANVCKHLLINPLEH